MTDNQVRLYVRRDPDGPLWLWDVYEDGDRCYVAAGTCHTWAHAMTFGILALHRAYGLRLRLALYRTYGLSAANQKAAG